MKVLILICLASAAIMIYLGVAAWEFSPAAFFAGLAVVSSVLFAVAKIAGRLPKGESK